MNAALATYGDGASDKTILLLHGGPGVPDYLAGVSAIFRDSYRVVRFDQRGTGGSWRESGRFALDDYIADVEAVRAQYELERFDLFGHSWGGLVAQLYASAYPDRVAKLCLCNSSIGLGEDWRAMERAVMTHNRRRGGLAGFALLGVNQWLSMLPGTVGDRAARRMMARVWRNYFDPPESAPAPSEDWLDGIHSRPIFATRRAALEGDSRRLCGFPGERVLIVFGEYDIYGSTTERLISRYPAARCEVIRGAGHIPWLQNPAAFVEVLSEFFALT